MEDVNSTIYLYIRCNVDFMESDLILLHDKINAVHVFSVKLLKTVIFTVHYYMKPLKQDMHVCRWLVNTYKTMEEIN